MSERKRNEQGALILPRMGADGGYYFECCDCALVHRLDFSITPENGLEMRVYGDALETEKARARQAAADEGFLEDGDDRPADNGSRSSISLK